jgi:hypothetical protein
VRRLYNNVTRRAAHCNISSVQNPEECLVKSFHSFKSWNNSWTDKLILTRFNIREFYEKCSSRFSFNLDNFNDLFTYEYRCFCQYDCVQYLPWLPWSAWLPVEGESSWWRHHPARHPTYIKVIDLTTLTSRLKVKSCWRHWNCYIMCTIPNLLFPRKEEEFVVKKDSGMWNHIPLSSAIWHSLCMLGSCE